MRRRESGAAAITAVLAVAAFLVLVSFAAQVLLGLYATSVVTEVTYEAARTVAGADVDETADARSGAESRARSRLGEYGEEATFEWRLTRDAVLLTVRAPRPVVLPRALVSGTPAGDIVRTVRVRLEEAR